MYYIYIILFAVFLSTQLFICWLFFTYLDIKCTLSFYVFGYFNIAYMDYGILLSAWTM